MPQFPDFLTNEELSTVVGIAKRMQNNKEPRKFVIHCGEIDINFSFLEDEEDTEEE